MKFYFSQASKINQTLSNKDLERNSLLSDLEKTKQALEIAYIGFDNVTEPDLIDCYIYELNSVLKRYDYLLDQMNKLHPSPIPEVQYTPYQEQVDKLQPYRDPVGVSDAETSASAMIG